MGKPEELAQTVSRRIRKGEWPSSSQLPTIRRLAVEWETSPVTVLQVLQHLETDSLVCRIPGRKGYFLKGAIPIPPKSKDYPRHRQRHLAIAEALHADILTGVYPFGEPFPSLKELQGRFACTYATIRAAFSQLESLGAVVRQGRGYITRTPLPPGKGNAQVFLVDHPYILRIFQGHAISFIRSVEADIQKMGWGQLGFLLSKEPELTEGPPDHQVAGFLHFANYRSETWVPYFRSRRRVPLVVIDTNEEFFKPGKLSGRPHFCVHADNREAGRDVAQALAELGHRHVAYLNHFKKDAVWVEYRFRGLGEIFSEKEGDRSLTRFDLEYPLHGSPLDSSISRLWNAFAQEGNLPKQMLQERLNPVYDMARMHEAAKKMESLFEQALALEKVTAWVCCNDEVAALAMAFLENRKIRIPGRVAVVGFDNSILAYRMGLTTYDFQFSRMGHMALRCLSEPNRVPSDSTGNIRIPGQLIARASTHG